jgi:predicted permease
MEALDMLGRAALAAGILAAGAGLDLSALRRPGIALGGATVLRLVGMPLLAALFAGMLGVSGPALAVAIIATAVPTATASYVLARRMGGDAKLISEIITLQTVAAVVTLPLAVAFLT